MITLLVGTIYHNNSSLEIKLIEENQRVNCLMSSMDKNISDDVAYFTYDKFKYDELLNLFNNITLDMNDNLFKKINII